MEHYKHRKNITTIPAGNNKNLDCSQGNYIVKGYNHDAQFRIYKTCTTMMT